MHYLYWQLDAAESESRFVIRKFSTCFWSSAVSPYKLISSWMLLCPSSTRSFECTTVACNWSPQLRTKRSAQLCTMSTALLPLCQITLLTVTVATQLTFCARTCKLKYCYTHSDLFWTRKPTFWPSNNLLDLKWMTHCHLKSLRNTILHSSRTPQPWTQRQYICLKCQEPITCHSAFETRTPNSLMLSLPRILHNSIVVSNVWYQVRCIMSLELKHTSCSLIFLSF